MGAMGEILRMVKEILEEIARGNVECAEVLERIRGLL